MILSIQDPNQTRFLDEASNHALLTPAEEIELLKLAQTGNKAAQRRLCAQNMKFVISVARNYQYSGIPLRDLIGEGVQGIYRAMQAYDTASKYRFTSYAVWWVRQAMTTALNERSRTVRITSQHEAPIRKLRRSQLHQAIGGEWVEDVEAFAKDHRLPPRNLLASLQASFGGFRLDQPMNPSGAVLSEILPSAAPTPEESAQEKDRLAILNRLRGKLTPIQRRIVTLAYGLDDHTPLTLRDIGIQLNLSHERVRQIRNDAMDKMKTLAKRFRE